MLLNILEATQLIDHAVLFPRYIIVEPDFLVDISSIAGCFKDYGHHPLNYTVGRLQRAEVTQPILLGNYAGAALDALLSGKSTSFAHILQECFMQQPLEYMACEGFNAVKFKTDALEQARNISGIIDALSEKYDLSTALLEPSFICEALGLQGRVDMMTTDLRLLIEQKSGKNFNLATSQTTDIGFHVESHYVQLLLYFLVLYFNFGVSREDIDFYLLYSKYSLPTGLLPVDFHDKLIREALKLRNQIVATELLIADKSFSVIRPLLRTDILNARQVNGNLWTRYQQPQLDALLAPLKVPTQGGCEDLLLRYFDAMATFVYREQRASWLGESDDVSTAISYLWKMTIEEKLDTGNIIMDLKPSLPPDSGVNHQSSIINYQFAPVADSAEDSQISTPKSQFAPLNFRRGDSIILYEYNVKTPETPPPPLKGEELAAPSEAPPSGDWGGLGVGDCRGILHKGNIIRITADSVTVALRNPLRLSTSPSPDTRFAIEHSSTNSSTTFSLRSLFAFLTASPSRQALLLAQRPPTADTSRTISSSQLSTFNSQLSTLNSQLSISPDILLRMKQANDYFLLIGPPGTGKTSQALRLMVQETLASSSPATSILLLSYTNRAVDEICEMLGNAGIDFLRIGNEFATDERWVPHLLSTKAKECGSLSRLKEELLRCRVVVGTTSTISARTYLFSIKNFSLAIIDEASQILEPNILGILSQPIDKFVLIGDYKQLPAVVQQSPEESRVDDKLLNDICLTDCRNSLFERLINIERKAGRTQFVGLLHKQGRMHPDIANVANEFFYKEENLQPVPLPHQLEGESQSRLCFFDVKKTEQSNDKINRDEAKLAAQLVNEVRERYGNDFNPHKTIGIIVPYRNQIATIRQELQKYNLPEYEKISIDTVERYQGSQRDVIIYSFTVSKEYQLAFLTSNTFYENGRPIDRKLNVALTRARKQFMAIGDRQLLSRNTLFRQFISRIDIAQ